MKKRIIKNKAKNYVDSEIKKYGFWWAYDFFCYNINWEKSLNQWDKYCLDEFDKMEKKLFKI